MANFKECRSFWVCDQYYFLKIFSKDFLRGRDTAPFHIENFDQEQEFPIEKRVKGQCDEMMNFIEGPKNQNNTFVCALIVHNHTFSLSFCEENMK